MKKFTDFAEERPVLDGPKMKLDDVIGNEIVIIGHRIKKSKYDKNESGKCLTIQFCFVGDDEKRVCFTGSDVLIEQFERYGIEIPFQTTIKKVDRYYTLS